MQYASHLQTQGYETPETVLAAGTAKLFSQDCELPIGLARVIWQAAGGSPGGRHPLQMLQSFAGTTGAIGPGLADHPTALLHAPDPASISGWTYHSHAVELLHSYLLRKRLKTSEVDTSIVAEDQSLTIEP